jgi:endonuclease YncB( thermonuclease family)
MNLLQYCCCAWGNNNKEEDNDYLNDPIKWEDTTPFAVPISGGQVIKVYDGDTITIASKLQIKDSPLYRFSVRLNGIDTPEIKGQSEDEKSVAKEARDALTAMILHKNIHLKNVTTEKYGRILADVYLDNLHINNWLIEQRFAVTYDGGTKLSPKSWVRYRLVGER